MGRLGHRDRRLHCTHSQLASAAGRSRRRYAAGRSRRARVRCLCSRPWDDEPVHEPQTPILIPGVLIDVKGSAATRLTIKTAQGNVTVSPFAAKPAAPGNIAVDIVPTPLELSTGDYQNDFPTIMHGVGPRDVDELLRLGRRRRSTS